MTNAKAPTKIDVGGLQSDYARFLQVRAAQWLAGPGTPLRFSLAGMAEDAQPVAVPLLLGSLNTAIIADWKSEGKTKLYV